MGLQVYISVFKRGLGRGGGNKTKQNKNIPPVKKNANSSINNTEGLEKKERNAGVVTAGTHLSQITLFCCTVCPS